MRLRFQALAPDGRVETGFLEAEHERAATEALSARGLLPIALADAPRAPVRLKTPELAMVLTGLSTLLHAGVPLDRALGAVSGSPRQRELADLLRSQLRSGRGIADALASVRGIPGIVTGLVRAGEQSGLSEALGRAGAQMEREAELRRRIAAALAYPLILIAFGAVVVTVLLVGVLPRFVDVMGGAATALPASTQFMLSASTLLRDRWGSIAALGAVLAFAAGAFLRAPPGQRFLIAVPILGHIQFGLSSARVIRAMTSMLRVGAPALAALRAGEEAAGSAEPARRVRAAAERVRLGGGLAASLSAEHAISDSSLQLARIGEESGRLADMLEHGAVLDEQGSMRSLDAVIRLIEPMLIVCLGALVAAIALAFLQGLYALRPT